MDSLTIFILGGGGILKLFDLDSLTIFIGGGGILKLSDLDSLTIFILGRGGILKLSDLDSLTIFIWGGILELFYLDSLTIFMGGGHILKLYFRIGGILEEFGPKFQPLQQAHASQIVSHILRMWRLINIFITTLFISFFSIPLQKTLTQTLWKILYFDFIVLRTSGRLGHTLKK